MSNFTLIGDRILVLLDKAKDHTQRASGIIVPQNDLVETDGGRVAATLSKKTKLMQGTIEQISEYSTNKLKELGVTLNVGDRVFISPQAINSPSYIFYTDRSTLVIEDAGYICIPHVLIEAKINND